MEQAQPGQLLVSSRVYKTAAEQYHFSPLPPITFKGITQPLPIYAVSGEKTERLIHLMEPSYTLPLVGRRAGDRPDQPEAGAGSAAARGRLSA